MFLCIGKIQVLKKRNRSLKLTLVCSFRSCLMSARFSPSFALSSRKRPTTSEVWPIQDLIALSLLRWASINCQKVKDYHHWTQTAGTRSWYQTQECCKHFGYYTHRFIELLAGLRSIHFAWEGDCGHGGVQGMDYAVIYGAHNLQHLLRDTQGCTNNQ